MGQPAGDGVPGHALAAAAPAPPIGLHDPAGQHRTTGFQQLAGDLQAKLVEAGERRQVSGSEGSVKRVEVFQMGSVRTSIRGGPRPLSTADPAASLYTLICDEPVVGLFKNEAIAAGSPFRDGPLRQPADAERVTTDYVRWYDYARLHGEVDDVTPEEYKQAH